MYRYASTCLTRRSRASYQLTKNTISKLFFAHAQVCFDLFDTKKQDYLSADDLDEIMRAMGFRPSKEELQVKEWIFKYDFFLCLCITPA
jgi:Ca2+-binding EF-hand superfamily protein